MRDPNPHQTEHRVYLAAALAAAAFSKSRRRQLVSAYDSWAECIDAATELSDALYDRWRADGIVWGEDLDQYDILDRIAEFWHAIECHDDTPRTPACIVDCAISMSRRRARDLAAGQLTDGATDPDDTDGDEDDDDDQPVTDEERSNGPRR